MGLGVDIGVHPDRDGRDLTQRLRNRVELRHLGFGFDVELPNAPFKRQPDFRRRFADTRKNDPVTRYARGLGA